MCVHSWADMNSALAADLAQRVKLARLGQNVQNKQTAGMVRSTLVRRITFSAGVPTTDERLLYFHLDSSQSPREGGFPT